jgi:uncharacterized protein DUF4184
VPYAFAHPAAVVPLSRVLGRFAVPSALAIGSMIPDSWYLLYFVHREDSHSLGGMLWYCLPAGLFAYAAFHLIFKQPLLALLPRALAGKLGTFTSLGLPPVRWRAVLLSLLAGASTHLAWDALTHGYEVGGHQILQHASTLFGTAFVAWWLWKKLRATPAVSATRVMPGPARAAIVAALVLVSAVAFLSAALTMPSPDLDALRDLLHAGSVIAVSAFGLMLVAYCVLWRRRPGSPHHL